MMLRLGMGGLLGLLLLGPCAAQDTLAVRQAAEVPLSIRQFDEAALDAHRRDAAYQYAPLPIASLTWWDRVMRWLSRWWQGLTQGGGAWQWALEYLIYALAVGGVIWLGIRLSGMSPKGLFQRERSSKLAFAAIEENLAEADLDALLAEALAAGDHRRAIRLYYLKALQDLAAAQLIHWKPERTNHDYLRDLRDPALRDAFRRLTDGFAYVWYGDFPANATALRWVREAFQSVETRIGEVRP